jgi:chaperonin GroEL (HSP60 family)
VSPCRLIGNNAGAEGDVIVQHVMDGDFNFGYDAMTGEYGDLIQKGVLDPKKVTRSGVQNACSIAGMVLTTQAVITEIPKKKVAAGAAAAPDPDSFSL